MKTTKKKPTDLFSIIVTGKYITIHEYAYVINYLIIAHIGVFLIHRI